MNKSNLSLQDCELASTLPESCALTVREAAPKNEPSLLPTRAEALFGFVTGRAVDLRVDLEEVLKQLREHPLTSLSSSERHKRMLSQMALVLLSLRVTALIEHSQMQPDYFGLTPSKNLKAGCTCQSSTELESAPGSYCVP